MSLSADPMTPHAVLRSRFLVRKLFQPPVRSMVLESQNPDRHRQTGSDLARGLRAASCKARRGEMAITAAGGKSWFLLAEMNKSDRRLGVPSPAANRSQSDASPPVPSNSASEKEYN